MAHKIKNGAIAAQGAEIRQHPYNRAAAVASAIAEQTGI